MRNAKKFSIRARLDRSPYYYVRGRRRDGSRYEYPTSILIEPPDDTPEELRGSKREAQRAQARETAEVVWRRERGEIAAEECECRLKGIAQRVMRQDSKVSTAYFFVAWVWEHVLRGKVHPNRAGKIARVMYAFLKHLGAVAHQTVHELRSEHFETFILERRLGKLSQKVANDELILLQAIGKAIKEKTAIDPTANLELEEEVTQERMPFTHDEVNRIFEAVYVMREYAAEWRTFLLLLLYTQMRPEDAAVLRRKDVDVEGGTIRFIAQKLEGYGKKLPPKPMHNDLWNYLREMLQDLQLDPEDYLCPTIASKHGNNLNGSFVRILMAANIDPKKALAQERQKAWSEKSLYSLRHTGITWMAAVGANDEEQKVELGDSTTKALKHYQHPNDPALLAAEHRRVNQLPSVGLKWQGVIEPQDKDQKRSLAKCPEKASASQASLSESKSLAKRRRRLNQMPAVPVKWTKS